MLISCAKCVHRLVNFWQKRLAVWCRLVAGLTLPSEVAEFRVLDFPSPGIASRLRTFRVNVLDRPVDFVDKIVRAYVCCDRQRFIRVTLCWRNIAVWC